MTPRPRKRKNAGLPENLYTVKSGKATGYRYRHPIKKTFHGMGSDKTKAIAAAKRLNGLLMPQNDLVSAVVGVVTLADHIDWHFKEIIPKRKYKKNTLSVHTGKADLLKQALGEHPIEAVSVLNISDLMATLTARPAQQLRTVATDIFKTAAGRGLIENNPAELTNKPVYEKSRKRLTSEQFDAMIEASPLWLVNAMQIGLITLQRRGDISRLRFEKIKDGFLYVVQEKTEKYDTGYLKIEIGPALSDALVKCRDDIASPYLIHRKPQSKIKREGCDHWTQLEPAKITREFKKVRDKLEEFQSIPMDKRPTFHEIKALGIKQYKDSGFEPQQLAGHSSEKMTNNYDSDHEEIRWIETKTR